MRIFRGKRVTDGIAAGRLQIYRKEKPRISRETVSDTAEETARFKAAVEEAVLQIEQLKSEALETTGASGGEILEAHRMLLEDEGFKAAVEAEITQNFSNAGYAVEKVSESLQKKFSQVDDAYMRERAADIKDVADRLLEILCRERNAGSRQVFSEPVILAAEDLSPSETIGLPKEKILAFVTVKGSLYSHTAILAKSMNIPALVGAALPLDESLDGKPAVLDGEAGILYVEPDEKTLKELQEHAKQKERMREEINLLRGKENITSGGRKIEIYANIGGAEDLPAVLENDAGGIGLLRSEFLYLGRQDYPSEEEQFSVYKKVAETMAGKPVIIRTLDIGADKQASYLKLQKEENPAMGLRGIRLCLERPEVFKTQLRAIYRASVYGNVAVMYPMIISLKEVQQAKKMAAQVRKELAEEGISCENIRQGIMIETPAAVMISAELAREVDFFSIGTNDLTQYALAADRQNPRLEAFYDKYHPAVFAMIETAVKNAGAAGIPVGICGELGADTALTETFLKMGVTELSVPPGQILLLRKAVRESDLKA